MTPLQTIAKAICDWENENGKDAPIDFEYIRKVPHNQYYQFYMAQARKIATTLAEADLPDRMEDDKGCAVYPHERDGMYRDVFRVMLRAIAIESP